MQEHDVLKVQNMKILARLLVLDFYEEILTTHGGLKALEVEGFDFFTKKKL